MARKSARKKKGIRVAPLVTITVLVMVAAIIAVAVILASQQDRQEIQSADRAESCQPVTFLSVRENIVTIHVPAVDQDGKGVTATITVTGRSGKGSVLTNIENLLFWVDTQSSILTAREVAGRLTDINLSSIDLVYDIKASAQAIEGPSAGAALTVATIAAIQGKAIPQHIFITGTIQPDGTIGPVGGVAEKVQAARDAGGTIFIAPAGTTSSVIGYEKKEQCETVGRFEWCQTQYQPKKKSLSNTTGITIIEVETVKDALKVFFGENV